VFQSPTHLNPVYARRVDPLDLTFSLSSHRHSYTEPCWGLVLQHPVFDYSSTLIYKYSIQISIYPFTINFCSYSVSGSIVSFTPEPTPRARSSLSHTHNIHTPTLPTPTILTFTCTQVLWFLPCLPRTRASGVTTRPDTSPTIISRLFLPSQPDTHLYVFSLTLDLPLIYIKKDVKLLDHTLTLHTLKPPSS
jgi:hypothetical protein